MEIILLRHGAAANTRPGGSDAERELTEQGIEAVGRVAARASAARVQPALILSSPYTRAVATAEIAARVLRYGKPVARTVSLLPDISPFDAWEAIRAHAEGGQVLVVAHEPLLGSLAGFLLGCVVMQIRMPPGAMLAIQIEHPAPEPQGVLQWMITPATA